MNRTYDQEWYKKKVDRIYEIMPECAISADIIAGFCTETEEEHKDTLEVMTYSDYTMSYMFKYSERPGTLAERKYTDDIPAEVKKKAFTRNCRPSKTRYPREKNIEGHWKKPLKSWSKGSRKNLKMISKDARLIIKWWSSQRKKI